MYCYLNGSIQPLSEAGISLTDIAVLRGYAVVDVLKTHHAQPFLLQEHIERFFNSASAMRLSVPASKEEISSAVQTLLSKNPFLESVVRMVLTGGPVAPDGISCGSGTATLFIITEEFVPLAPSVYTHGVSLITHEYQRQFPHVKTIDYVTAVYLQKEKREAGATEILYTSGGFISEAATSNFFLVRGNTIVTAKDNVLNGITRQVVLRLASEKFQVEERAVRVEELSEADEAFLTATNKYVVPVVKVGNQQIGLGKPGPVSQTLLDMYTAFADKTCP